jgi:hypothetical protein
MECFNPIHQIRDRHTSPGQVRVRRRPSAAGFSRHAPARANKQSDHHRPPWLQSLAWCEALLLKSPPPPPLLLPPPPPPTHSSSGAAHAQRSRHGPSRHGPSRHGPSRHGPISAQPLCDDGDDMQRHDFGFIGSRRSCDRQASHGRERDGGDDTRQRPVRVIACAHISESARGVNLGESDAAEDGARLLPDWSYFPV